MERPKQMSEGSNRAANSLPEVRHGLPEASRRGNQGGAQFLRKNGHRSHRFKPIAYSRRALILSP
jgi:hypothetical protein